MFTSPATYLDLPEPFWHHQDPEPVRDPRMLIWNRDLSDELNIPRLSDAIWGGSETVAGSAPFAQAYAGHQFGHFTLLGDGRALVLGEHVAPDGQRVDLQLKGSGRTPYSRRGDGRAALEPMLREYLISEAMHALGIPTTRSLAVVLTGEGVMREEPLPGAVLTRVAASHIRVGTFEYAAQLGVEALEALLSYSIERHAPHCAETESPALAFLEHCLTSQASLIARWMSVGFVHGVMNTDNMALSGETIDYGPCAFMDVYHPETVFSSIDSQGRYAYGNQARIAHWNLAVLASALLAVIGEENEEKARAVLDLYPERFHTAWRETLAAKVGIIDPVPEDDEVLGDLLEHMQETKLDFTRTFLELEQGIPEALTEWGVAWEKRVGSLDEARERMQQVNPVIIPRNYQVEAALKAAGEGDLQPFNDLLQAVQAPFGRSLIESPFAQPPPPGTPRTVTFCGT